MEELTISTFTTPAKKQVEVQPTPYGFGVFAASNFRAGELVAQIEGTMIPDPEFESDYCMDLNNGHVLEPDAPFRFLNHSCMPNCELVQFDVEFEDGAEADPELWLEVIRDILPGEQLTIDYAWPADVAIPCLCGAEQCRGWIVDVEELHCLTSSPVEKPSHHKMAPHAAFPNEVLEGHQVPR